MHKTHTERHVITEGKKCNYITITGLNCHGIVSRNDGDKQLNSDVIRRDGEDLIIGAGEIVVKKRSPISSSQNYQYAWRVLANFIVIFHDYVVVLTEHDDALNPSTVPVGDAVDCHRTHDTVNDVGH